MMAEAVEKKETVPAAESADQQQQLEEEEDAFSSADLTASSSSSLALSGLTERSVNQQLKGYLLKKTKHGKWQKRWFETNGCFLTYYKKQGQKLLAALNLPQVGEITLLPEDTEDGPGLFTIELNERVYTIKAKDQEEADIWVKGLKWRQSGGGADEIRPTGSTAVAETSIAKEEDKAIEQQEEDKQWADEEKAPKSLIPCLPCCTMQ